MFFRLVLCCVAFFANANVNGSKDGSAKIAILDMNKVMNSSDDVRELMQKLKRLEMEYEKEYKEKFKKIESLYEELKRKSTNSKTDAEKNEVKELESRVHKQKQDLDKEAEGKYKELAALRDNKMQQLQQKIISISQKISDEKKVLVVSAAILVTYPSDQLDVTDIVVKSINKDREGN